jgi:hypothetical protein
MPQKAANLRNLAARCRRLALVSTEGGHDTDRLLLTLAATFEREATAREMAAPPIRPSLDALRRSPR